MSDVSRLEGDALAYLEAYLPPQASTTSPDDTTTANTCTCSTQFSASTNNGLPFVTLTYAASLDSMIALAPGARTTLSGPETKSMTHYLRYKHDAILVGANTAVVDDPALNCRYPEATLLDQPRPIIVDPNGRWKGIGKKAYTLAAEGEGKSPWVITTSRTIQKNRDSRLHDIEGDYVMVDESSPANGVIDWEALLRTLYMRGVKSVMIEGGATVINSLLAQPKLVNAVIITIAPTFLGQGGVVVSPAARDSSTGEPTNAAWLDQPSWRQFGNDVVLCAHLRG